MASLNLVEIESVERKSEKISFFEYLFVLMLILYAGRGNKFFAAYDSIIDNPIGVMVPVLLSGILVLRLKVQFNRQFIILIYFLACYFLAVSVKYNEIHPTIFLIYIFLFFVAYSTIKVFRFNLLFIYEYILYYLAIIGLLMWGIQIILGGDTLYDLFSKIPLIKSVSYVSGNGLNAIIYSVTPTSFSQSYELGIPRNCGYTWEPGAFAAYLCLAIFVNLFVTNYDKNNKKRFWIFLLALITTQSTSGYVIFGVMIISYLGNKNLKKILLLLPFVITAMILLSSLPFMKNKIIDLINETSTIDQMVEGTINSETGFAAQRFSSFYIAFVDFRNNPVLGLGNIEKTWTSKLGGKISTISGIGDLLAQHGIVGFLFFIIVTLKSSFIFSKYFNYKGAFLLFLIMILISISYSIILTPIVMSFWMFALFEDRNINKEDVKSRILFTDRNKAFPT